MSVLLFCPLCSALISLAQPCNFLCGSLLFVILVLYKNTVLQAERPQIIIIIIIKDMPRTCERLHGRHEEVGTLGVINLNYREAD